MLGNGEQPKKPVTIVFDLHSTDLAVNVSDEKPLAVISWSGTPDSWEIEAGTWDANDQTLTVTTDHLSWRWLFQLDITKFVVDTVSGMLGVSFPKPPCAFKPVTIGSTPYSIAHSGADPIWPCLSTANDELLVDLHSNSNMSWAVKTNPSVTGSVSGGFKDLGPGLAAIYQGLAHLLGDERSVVMPGDTTRFRFESNARAIRIDAKQEPAVFIVATTLQVAISVLEALPTGKVAEFVLASFSTYDCFSEVINTFYENDSPEIACSVVTSTLTCLPGLIDAAAKNAVKSVPQLIVSTAAAVVGMLIGGASALWGYIQGIFRELTGSGTVSYMIAGGAVNEPSGDVPMFRGNAARTGAMPGPVPDFTSGIEERWSLVTVDGMHSSPAVLAGTVFVGSGSGIGSTDRNVYALDAKSGAERWRFATGDAVFSSPAVVDGMVFVGSNDGRLYALGARIPR